MDVVRLTRNAHDERAHGYVRVVRDGLPDSHGPPPTMRLSPGPFREFSRFPGKLPGAVSRTTAPLRRPL